MGCNCLVKGFLSMDEYTDLLYRICLANGKNVIPGRSQLEYRVALSQSNRRKHRESLNARVSQQEHQGEDHIATGLSLRDNENCVVQDFVTIEYFVVS